jgi:predicted transcriptional regulator
MVRTQIQLTESQAQRLKRLAAMRAESIAELIRQSIERFLDTEDTHNQDSDAAWERAILEQGLFRSGLPDLARNHDIYLVEAYSNGLYTEPFPDRATAEKAEQA